MSASAPLILVAEDDVDARRILARHLATLGARIVEVDDGHTALAALRQHRPDLIVLDLNLPEMSGFSLARQVRADKAMHDIPILVVSGRNSLEDHALAKEVGVTEYMSKPVKRRDLLAAAKRLLPSA